MHALRISSDEKDWDLAVPYLEQAMEHGGGSRDWTLEDLRVRIMESRLTLWVMLDGEHVMGAGVTTLVRYPQRLVVEVLLFACEPHSGFLDVLPDLKHYAGTAGASIIQGTGRPGWAKKLKAKQRIVWELEV